MERRTTTETTRASVMTWLRSPVTLTLPGWGVAAGAGVILLLGLVALD